MWTSETLTTTISLFRTNSVNSSQFSELVDLTLRFGAIGRMEGSAFPWILGMKRWLNCCPVIKFPHLFRTYSQNVDFPIPDHFLLSQVKFAREVGVHFRSSSLFWTWPNARNLFWKHFRRYTIIIISIFIRLFWYFAKKIENRAKTYAKAHSITWSMPFYLYHVTASCRFLNCAA